MKSILSFKLNKKFVFKKTLFFLFLCFYSTLFSQNPCECALVSSSANPCPTPTLYPSLNAAVNAPVNGTVFSPALSFSTTSQTYTFCTRFTVPTGITSIGVVNFTTAEDLISFPRQNVNFTRTAWTAYEITGCTSPIIGAVQTTTAGGAAVFSVTPGKTYKFCVTVKASTNNPNGIVSSTEFYMYNATPASTSSCSASVGTINVSGGATLVGTNEYNLLSGNTMTFTSVGYTLPPAGDASNTQTMAYNVYTCSPTLPINATNPNSDPCFRAVSPGFKCPDGSLNGSSTTLSGHSTLWFVPVTLDISQTGNRKIDGDGDGCYAIGTPIKVNYTTSSVTPTPSACGTCTTANCPVKQVSTYANRSYLSDCNTLSADISNVTYVTHHTVKTDANGAVGLVQGMDIAPNPCPGLTRTAVLRPISQTCNSSANILSNVSNANSVSSGFNPEWYNLSPTTNYVAIITTMIPSGCIYGEGCLNAYGITNPPTPTTCSASVGTFTIKKNGTTATGTSFDLLPNEQLELISNNDFVTPPKAGADAAGLGYAVFKCNPSSFNLANKATFASATNSCFAGFYYSKNYTDINDGTSANSGGVKLGGLTTFWMVPITFDDICSPDPIRTTATCKTGDNNIGIDVNGDNCFKAGTPIQINYIPPCKPVKFEFYSDAALTTTLAGTTFSCTSSPIFLAPKNVNSEYFGSIDPPNQGWAFPVIIIEITAISGNLSSTNTLYKLYDATTGTLVENSSTAVGSTTATTIYHYFAKSSGYTFTLDKTNTNSGTYSYIAYDGISGSVIGSGTLTITSGNESSQSVILKPTNHNASFTCPTCGPGSLIQGIGPQYLGELGIGTFDPSKAGAGSHTITYSWDNGLTGSNNCNGTHSITVTVSGPTVSVTSASVCPGNNAILTASGATSYTWSTGATSSTVSVSPSSTTNYTVVGGGIGCTSTKIATVTLNATPTTTATTTGSLTCSTNTVQLSSTLSGLTYTWTAPLGGSVSSTNAQSTTASLAAGIYSLSVKNSAGCVYTTTTAVTQNTTTPSLSAGPSGTLTCGTKSITLSGSVSSPTNATLSWTGQNVCGSVSSATSTACAAGIYTLTATSPLNGCKSTSTVEIFSDASVPTVTVSTATLELNCNQPAQTATITSTSSGLTYSWNPSPALGGNAAIATFSNSNTYTCVITNSISCSAEIKVTVTSNTTVPTTSITVLGDLTCVPGSSVHLNAVNNFTTALNYTWTAPSTGSIVTSVNDATVAVNSAGNYSLTVKNPANGCSYVSSAVVNSNTATPTILFSANPMSGTAPLEVNFANQSSGATDYSWNFGNNSTLTTTQTINPSSTFTAIGTYTVELNGTDAISGCQASYRLIIEVIEGSSLEVPNVFTPNEDGANDLFKIICSGITELSCEIYNRWGTKVYEITSAGDSWDGAENPAGTYFYILNAKGKDAKEYNSKGFITMFK